METITVRKHGPVFNGRAHAQVLLFLAAATKAIAEQGVNEVHQLQGVYKHPTGYYENHIVTDRVDDLSNRVWDSEVIYGNWLEGTGSRNQTTRFKGYATFRKATQSLQKRAPSIAFRLLEKFIKGMR